MNLPEPKLNIASSPHLKCGLSVRQIMLQVLYALIPVCFFAVYAFGLSALLILMTAILSCLLTEKVFNYFSGQNLNSSDLSVIITGVLFGLTLPPALPLWMVCVGGFFSISLGKFIFGGLGFNPFNPALVGRAFLQAAFPSAMTQWSPAFAADRFSSLPTSSLTFPFFSPEYDQLSSATPLAALKFSGSNSSEMDLFLGLNHGSLGETCSILILCCGLYLIYRGLMNWRIPAGIFLVIILLTNILSFTSEELQPSVFFMMFSGGLMLGAMFMATDPVASPITHWGCFVYGCIIGLLIFIIRIWGGMPEGVMYAILLANAISPHIDKLFQPVPFGRKNA